MALPAPVLPESLVADRLPPEVSTHLQEYFTPAWSQLMTEVKANAPVEGTAEEEQVLRRFAWLGLLFVQEVGSALADALRMALNDGLRNLIQRQSEPAEQERKLALRHLELSLETFGVFLESVTPVLAELPDLHKEEWLTEAMNELQRGEAELDPHARTVLRWELALAVAFDLLDGPAEQLALWSHAAIVGARRVSALLSAGGLQGFRGELARFRARRTWGGWDDEELEREVEPWNSPRRSQ